MSHKLHCFMISTCINILFGSQYCHLLLIPKMVCSFNAHYKQLYKERHSEVKRIIIHRFYIETYAHTFMHAATNTWKRPGTRYCGLNTNLGTNDWTSACLRCPTAPCDRGQGCVGTAFTWRTAKHESGVIHTFQSQTLLVERIVFKPDNKVLSTSTLGLRKKNANRSRR
jgi:hypothetical protein